MNEELRQFFPIIKNYIYLNHAAITPYSTRVNASLAAIINDITENGAVNWHNWLALIDQTRAAAARLIGAQTEQIAFVGNTSDGLSAIANGIDWRAGDNIVSCDIEFPANVYPWMRLAKYGVELRQAHALDGRVIPDTLFALVDSRTRLIALSWVQYASGLRADLGTIGAFCREHNLLFVLDAIQGLGALQLDVEADLVDALTADSHKFLMGPEGLGLLFLSSRALAQVQPSVVGWMSVKEWWRCFDEKFDYQLDYLPGTLRFECGTPNTIGLHALHAALTLILEVGPARIESYLLDLCDYLRAGLARLGFEQLLPKGRSEASAIVCCRHPKHSPEEFYQALIKRKIICAPRCGWLRISPHFYNSYTEIDTLLAALAELTS
ncbi:MAG: aminotransferase class V-fold PLP-dependent enzyme [Acidobacteriota bacterium]